MEPARDFLMDFRKFVHRISVNLSKDAVGAGSKPARADGSFFYQFSVCRGTFLQPHFLEQWKSSPAPKKDLLSQILFWYGYS